MLPLSTFSFLEVLAMKTNMILFSLLLATFCLATVPVIAQSNPEGRYFAVRPINSKPSSLAKQHSSSSQAQSSTITIDAASLQEPNLLYVKGASNTTIEGQITIDGVVVKQLEGDTTSLNLSPYLSSEKTKVEISGSYTPKSSSVKVEFIGPDTNVIQQTGGNGLLKQTLVIEVI